MEIIGAIITGTTDTIIEIITSASRVGINTIIPFVCIYAIAFFYIASFFYADRKIKELDKKELESKEASKAAFLFSISGENVPSQEEIDNTKIRLIKYLEKKSEFVNLANGIAVKSVFFMAIFALVYSFVSAVLNEYTGSTGRDFVSLIFITFIGILAPDSILGMTGIKKPFEEFNGELEISNVIDKFDEFNETDISAEEARRIMSNDVAKNYIQRVVRIGRRLTNMEFGMLITHVDNTEVTADIEAVKEIIYGKEFKQRNV